MMPYGSFSLQLIALTAGITLFIWSLNSEGRGAGLGRFFGFIIMILALVSVICTIYMSVKFWMQMSPVAYEVVQMQEQVKETASPAKEAPKEKSTNKKK